MPYQSRKLPHAILLATLSATLLISACGKKGDPSPPAQTEATDDEDTNPRRQP